MKNNKTMMILIITFPFIVSGSGDATPNITPTSKITSVTSFLVRDDVLGTKQELVKLALTAASDCPRVKEHLSVYRAVVDGLRGKR